MKFSLIGMKIQLWNKGANQYENLICKKRSWFEKSQDRFFAGFQAVYRAQVNGLLLF